MQAYIYLLFRIHLWMLEHGYIRGSSVSNFPKRCMCEGRLTVSAVQLLAQVSFFILGAKVRSRALLFLYKLFFQLVYHIFYRNLVSSSPILQASRRPELIVSVCAFTVSLSVRYSPVAIVNIGRHHLSSADEQNMASPSTDCRRIPSALGGSCG